MAIIAKVVAGPEGPRDIVLRNLKEVARRIHDFDDKITATELLPAVIEIISTDLEVKKTKSKKAE